MQKMRTAQLAKLTRPRLHHATSRARLFELLDRARTDRPAIYVCGPPGSGKTTLVATWLVSRRVDGIWYQVDSGDADLATFFHYLAVAVEPFSRKGQLALPTLSPERLHDVASFSRRFFRELFGRLPSQAAVVLDNYQEVDASNDLHKIVAQAIQELPVGYALILISREDPPQCYARHIVNESVAFISGEHLELSLDEALSIARVRSPVERNAIAQIHKRCAGWAAGFTLLLEQADRRLSLDASDRSGSLRTLYDYFAGQFYDRLTLPQQRFLLSLSFLPSMTQSAAELVAQDNAAWTLLEELFRRRLFVDVRQARLPEFQFHSLFRAFLQDRAQLRLTESECRDLHRLAGDALRLEQKIESSFASYVTGGAMQSARDLILSYSNQLISRGRWKTLVDWIVSLPSDMVAADCWLQYWMGRARMAVSPVDGRNFLESAHQLALTVMDKRCVLLSAAGIAESYILAYVDFRPLDAWIDVIANALAGDVAFLDADAEVKVRSVFVISCSYRRPDDPMLDECMTRVFELLPVLSDANLRVTAAAYLVGWGSTTGPIEVARRAVPKLREAIGASGVTAMNAAWGWFLISWYHCLLLEHEQSRAAIAMVEEIASSEDLPTARKFGPIIAAWLAMHANNLSAALFEVDRLEALTDHRHVYDRASIEGIRAWLAVLQRQPEVALVHGAEAVDFFDRTGSIMHQLNHRLPGVWAKILQRDFVDARARVKEMRRFANRTRSYWQEMELRATEAWIALEQRDRDVAKCHLESMLQIARQRKLEHVFGRHLSHWMPDLCAAALEFGIETEYVRTQIRRWGWSPPESRPQQWPWPVRIYTLGTFSVQIYDQSMTFARKAPRKPIALLKALVAFGSEPIPLHRVIDGLWPDDDGDAAQKAFEAALHRLRHLLRAPNAIVVRDNRVALNEQVVWSDKAAFETAVRDHECERAIDLYRGPFLPGDIDFGWSAPSREQLQVRYLQMLERAGTMRERLSAYPEAIDLYLRGIDIDDMHETFYQGLIRAYIALERPVDAIRTYRSLEQILEKNLGIKPSQATRSLAKAIGVVIP